MAGIYIHIPFCKQACSYCDFYFLTRGELKQPFVDALIEEIRHYGNHPISDETIDTIYIGGGTPSLLTPKQLKSIFTALETVFTVKPVEVTLEMNPDDVTEEFLLKIQDLGVDRASMGVQSFDEKLLQFMHRAHDPIEAVDALKLLQKANFPSYTADLIYGNPGQTMEMLGKDIDRLLTFDPPHISAYSLTIEPKTRLGKQVELGRIDPVDDDVVADQFDFLYQKLSSAGVEQYEVSNFAKPGKEAVHNSNYWRHKNYLGLGPSAHSLYWPDADNAQRWKNRSNLKSYLEQDWDGVREDEESLSLSEMAEERLMLGLRTKWGVSKKQLAERYGYTINNKQEEWLKKQQEQGQFTSVDDAIILSKTGLRIADYLIFELISRRL